jgi:hypothetical protein
VELATQTTRARSQAHPDVEPRVVDRMATQPEGLFIPHRAADIKGEKAAQMSGVLPAPFGSHGSAPVPLIAEKGSTSAVEFSADLQRAQGAQCWDWNAIIAAEQELAPTDAVQEQEEEGGLLAMARQDPEVVQRAIIGVRHGLVEMQWRRFHPERAQEVAPVMVCGLQAIPAVKFGPTTSFIYMDSQSGGFL